MALPKVAAVVGFHPMAHRGKHGKLAANQKQIMLKNIKEIYGTKLTATDGEIGHVKDFYFDDKSWAVRYLVVDTGTWLTGRLVLLAPQAFDGFGPDGETLSVNLTMDQIENSPSIESHRPVTRQFERDYYLHYNWPVYWESAGMWGIGGLPVLSPPLLADDELKDADIPPDDVHLRSTRALAGYKVVATDGQPGTVTGFLVDHKSWAIAGIVVEAGHWYAGKQILISPSMVRKVSYETSEIAVSLNMADIRRTSEDEVARALPPTATQ